MIESQRLSIRFSCMRIFRKKVPACESHLAKGRPLAVLIEQHWASRLFCQKETTEMKPKTPLGTRDERLPTQPGRPRSEPGP